MGGKLLSKIIVFCWVLSYFLLIKRTKKNKGCLCCHMVSFGFVHNSAVRFQMIHQTKQIILFLLLTRQLLYHGTANPEMILIGSVVCMSRPSCSRIGRNCPSVTQTKQQMHVFLQKRSGGTASTHKNGHF